jgi:hypothetical protein
VVDFNLLATSTFGTFTTKLLDCLCPTSVVPVEHVFSHVAIVVFSFFKHMVKITLLRLFRQLVTDPTLFSASKNFASSMAMISWIACSYKDTGAAPMNCGTLGFHKKGAIGAGASAPTATAAGEAAAIAAPTAFRKLRLSIVPILVTGIGAKVIQLVLELVV